MFQFDKFYIESIKFVCMVLNILRRYFEGSFKYVFDNIFYHRISTHTLFLILLIE